MSPLDLDALEKVLAAMTPGPWRFEFGDESGYMVSGNGHEVVGDMPLEVAVPSDVDASGIVALVNAAPAMIARIRELEAALGEASGMADCYCSEEKCDAHRRWGLLLAGKGGGE